MALFNLLLPPGQDGEVFKQCSQMALVKDSKNGLVFGSHFNLDPESTFSYSNFSTKTVNLRDMMLFFFSNEREMDPV